MQWHEIVHDNNFIPALAITLGFVLLCCTLLAITLVGLARVLRGGAGRQGKQRDAVETREFQEIQRGFTRMEQRIEALETLMLDSHKETSEPWSS